MLEPLKITAWLACGVISDRFMPLDGLLHYQLVRERYGAQAASLPGRSAIRIGGLTLPIRQVNQGQPDWYYACSFAQWPEHAVEGLSHWNKRLDVSLVDLIDFGGRRGNIPIAHGRYRNYHMSIFYRHALSVSWYLVGNSERIRQLLSTSFGLGKKTSMGWGAIKEWEIESCAADWSTIGPGGRIMRAIPCEGGVLYGVRPSYWDPRHQFPCKLPET